ncbi:hypothetical protein CspHIS471_0407660 [Cutaneotrichosporon sp. HIS471]|nr:hypothetical protein CspHIS471_0407660 [Cutaneotrichosporon sp. HIS471]
MQNALTTKFWYEYQAGDLPLPPKFLAAYCLRRSCTTKGLNSHNTLDAALLHGSGLIGYPAIAIQEEMPPQE